VFGSIIEKVTNVDAFFRAITMYQMIILDAGKSGQVSLTSLLAIFYSKKRTLLLCVGIIVVRSHLLKKRTSISDLSMCSDDSKHLLEKAVRTISVSGLSV
jgi:hypothetical protein